MEVWLVVASAGLQLIYQRGRRWSVGSGERRGRGVARSWIGGSSVGNRVGSLWVSCEDPGVGR